MQVIPPIRPAFAGTIQKHPSGALHVSVKSQDQFIRFGSLKTGNDFGRELNASRLSVEALLQQAIRPENLLGQGHNARVYAMPGFPDYVLRIPKGGISGKRSLHLLRTVPLGQYNLGQPVALIGNDRLFSVLNARILRRQKGQPGGIPYAENGVDYRLTGKEALLVYTQHLKCLAAMPQSTFDDLAEKVKQIEIAGCSWDYEKADNLLVDTDNQQLNPVDIEFYNSTQPGNTQYVLAAMVHCLSDYLYALNNDVSSCQPQFKVLLTKCLVAVRNTNLPPQKLSNSLTLISRLAAQPLPSNSVI